MTFAPPRINRKVYIRSGKQSLLLATFGADVVVNSSIEFNLVNELRRFFESSEAEDICLQITEGEKVLKSHYPEPDGLGILDAADLIAARSRIQCCLDTMLSGDLPNWVGQEESRDAKMKLVKLIESYTKQIELKGQIDADRHEQDGDVCPE